MPIPWYENKWLQWLLRPLAYLYRCVMQLRNQAYQRQIFHRHHIACPIICIGNLSVGGSGKTPVVACCVRYLQAHGVERVAILSRGYKRESSGTVIVTNGRNVAVDVRQSGDEPFWLATQLQNVPVIVDADRVRGAEFVRQRFQPQCILLDDGFQHRRLARDWDIVVVNSQTGFGNGRLLPAGPLREPLSGLERAHFVWLNHVNAAAATPGLLSQIQAFGVKPLIQADYTPKQLIALSTATVESLERLQQGRILAFSGIANPERFQRTLQALTSTEIRMLHFPDHHRFTPPDLERIQRQAQAFQAELVLTTEKDAVRLPVSFGQAMSFFYLKMELTIRTGAECLDQIAAQIR